jgi:hypothetical protein
MVIFVTISLHITGWHVTSVVELVLLNNLWIDYVYREWKMVWPASKYFPIILEEYLWKPRKIGHDSRKYWTRTPREGTKRLYACEFSLNCFYYEHLIQYNRRQRKFPIAWNFVSLILIIFNVGRHADAKVLYLDRTFSWQTGYWQFSPCCLIGAYWVWP